jgi:predicted Zn finger-like uncharacterized protein
MNKTRPLVIAVGVMPGGPATAVLLDDEQDMRTSAVCPMCHTSTSVLQSAIEAGGHWRCVRCGQHWDAGRLGAVAAYAEWAGDRDRVGRRGTEGRHAAALCGDSQAEPPGGRP